MKIEEVVQSAIEESVGAGGNPVRITVDNAAAAYEEVRPALGVSYEEPGSAEVFRSWRGSEMHVHGHDSGFQDFHIIIESRGVEND